MSNDTSPIRVSPRQMWNIDEALNVMWPSVPGRNVAHHLEYWRKDRKRTHDQMPPTCSTIACFGGWCALWPNFREQGVASDWGEPVLTTKARVGSWRTHYADAGDVSYYLFGDWSLFEPATPEEVALKVSSHEIVMRRLRALKARAVVGRKVQDKE